MTQFTMSFRKPPPPQKAEPPTYAWQKVDAKRQRMWINVKSWQFKVFPYLPGNEFCTFMFQKIDLRNDIAAVGEVETQDSAEPPGMLSDHWSNVPDRVEGFCFFMKSDDPTIPPSFAVTLYCKESAIDWVCRAFSLGTSSKGAVGVELEIDCPNQSQEDFWPDQWKYEWLRVISWKVFSGAEFR
ncbi:hypothetical protein [Nitrosomonas sp.]|uniref:hypothetical protein n=1 Tax=Nitrosomonas sp. TaxID=42353 RepID=UPI001DEF7381|nr:hypothetical protein [Nitrosomonas sp.]MBX3618079.1 hypothetical protein [Nitrosomonas sp.]